jgi:hypothetical protein
MFLVLQTKYLKLHPIVTEPLRATVALLTHTEISGPIATTGAPVNIITKRIYSLITSSVVGRT